MVKTPLLTQKTDSNGTKILEPAKVLVDSRERISIAYLKDFFEVVEVGEEVLDETQFEEDEESGELEIDTLMTGDVFFTDEQKLIEIKIGPDVRGLAQLHKECLQMYVWHNTQAEKFNKDQELHATCCNITAEDITWENARRKKLGLRKTKMKPFTITVDEYKVFASFCHQYNIYPHHCNSIQDMMLKLRKIRTAIYRPKMFIQGLKLPTVCAKWMNALPGISPDNAIKLADKLDNIPWNIFTANLPTLMDEVIGTNKGGKRKKVVDKNLQRIKFGKVVEEKK